MPCTAGTFNVYAEWTAVPSCLRRIWKRCRRFMNLARTTITFRARRLRREVNYRGDDSLAENGCSRRAHAQFCMAFVVGEERNSAGRRCRLLSGARSRVADQRRTDRKQSCARVQKEFALEIIARAKLAHWVSGNSANPLSKNFSMAGRDSRMLLPEDPILGRTTINMERSPGDARKHYPDAAKAEVAIRRWARTLT